MSELDDLHAIGEKTTDIIRVEQVNKKIIKQHVTSFIETVLENN